MPMLKKLLAENKIDFLIILSLVEWEFSVKVLENMKFNKTNPN